MHLEVVHAVLKAQQVRLAVQQLVKLLVGEHALALLHDRVLVARRLELVGDLQELLAALLKVLALVQRPRALLRPVQRALHELAEHVVGQHLAQLRALLRAAPAVAVVHVHVPHVVRRVPVAVLEHRVHDLRDVKVRAVRAGAAVHEREDVVVHDLLEADRVVLARPPAQRAHAEGVRAHRVPQLLALAVQVLAGHFTELHPRLQQAVVYVPKRPAALDPVLVVVGAALRQALQDEAARERELLLAREVPHVVHRVREDLVLELAHPALVGRRQHVADVLVDLANLLAADDGHVVVLVAH